MELNKTQKKMAVIGAGPAGLAAAYKLQQAGFAVDVYEASDDVGGLCKSFQLWGHTVDLGPHRFFSADEDVNRFWFQAVGENFSWVPRCTRIFYNQKYFNYPLDPLDTFLKLGFWESTKCILSYLWQKVLIFKTEENFEKWVQKYFGHRLYRIFFKTYSEKLWGISCRQIDADFAYRKIKKLSFFSILKKMLSQPKTFVDTFAYPHHGTGSVYKTISQRFEKMGGQLWLNTKVSRVEASDEQVRLTFASAMSVSPNEQTYDGVISTMPLTHLVAGLHAPAEVLKSSKRLHFRSTVLVYIWIEGKEHFADNWIYVHSDQVGFGRVTNFCNWSPEMNKHQEGTVLCLEYWCQTADEFWQKTDQQIAELAKKELKDSRIIEAPVVKGVKVLRVPSTYPVFATGYKKDLQVIKDFLQSFENLCTIGRYGSFKYNNQDHSVLMGLRAAESFIRRDERFKQAGEVMPDLQSINSQRQYEEDFELTDVKYDTFEEI